VRIIERDFDAAHPGHRDRIDDPSRRAATILDHHRHRTRRVLDVLADEGPANRVGDSLPRCSATSRRSTSSTAPERRSHTSIISPTLVSSNPTGPPID